MTGRLAALAVLAVGSVCSACSDSASRAESVSADDVAFSPADLRVEALPGGNGVLDLVGLSLHAADGGVELLAALKNVGERPACDAAFSVELFDRAQQSLASGISGLHAQHFYRRTDGSGSIASCVSPGDLTMAQLTDLGSDLIVRDVGYVIYRCPYFALDVEPVPGLALEHTRRVVQHSRSALEGTLVNHFDSALLHAAVSVFATNRAGRPLEVSTVSGPAQLDPGASWMFVSDSVAGPVAELVAFPSGAL